MAPPGRRRDSTLVSLLALFLLLVPQIHAAVIGIDIGTENIKAALVKPGIPLEIVLTKDSRRKEAASLAFKPATGGSADQYEYPERLYGADASALAARFPTDVFPNLKPLLGSLVDSQQAYDAFRERYPAIELAQDAAEKALTVKSKSSPQGHFSVEELLSMQLKNVKENAEIMAGKGSLIEDAVITVPAFYTADERLAVEHAAELAGLRVMSLVSDGMAVGLHYATSRTFPNIDEGADPEYHMIYDMGAGSTTATILRFQARTFKTGRFKKTNTTVQEVAVLGTDWDRSLGGDALNWLIVDDMIKQFVDSKGAKAAGVDQDAVRKHGRTMAKLWKEAVKARMVLSANTATSSSFEGLHDDVDFKYKITRADFEAMASDVAARIGKPIAGALASAKLAVSDLNSVVLHGGAVRTPFIQKQLEAITDDPQKLRSNVNADEAAVFGAAFKAAGLSPSFRVKEINTADASNYAVSLTWTSGDKGRRQTIFTPTSLTGAVKAIPFAKLEDFEVSLEQVVSDGDHRPLSTVRTTNVTTSVNDLIKNYGCQKDGIKTSLSARVNPLDGLPEILSGSVSCQSDQEKKKTVVEGVKGLFGFGGKKDAEAEDEAEAEASEAASSSSADPSSTSASAASSASDSAKNKTSATPKAPVIKTHVIQLALETTSLAGKKLPADRLKTIKERLVAFDASDASRRLREEVYNRLEASTYRIRDLLEDSKFISASTADQRKAIASLLSTTSEWLSADGLSAATDAVREKLTALQDLVGPIRRRVEEATKRPEAVKGLESALTSAESVTKIVKEAIDRAADEAASYAAAAAAAASETVSSVVEEATETILSPSDELDADEAESSSSSASSSSAKAIPTPEPALYTEADLSSITSLYDEAKQWLTDQLAAQKKLSASDEPVLLSTDVKRRAQELQEALQRVLSKTPPVRRAKSSGSGSSSSKKSKKSKASKKTSSSSSSATTTAEASVDAPEPTPEPAPEPALKHEEL